MDTAVADVVSTSATKLNFDKKFLVGVAVGATAVGTAVLVAKLKNRFASSETTDDNEL